MASYSPNLSRVGCAMNVDDMRTIEHAIDESQAYDRIVTLAWEETLAAEIAVLADGWVDAGDGVWEYWTDTWRIHLLRRGEG